MPPLVPLAPDLGLDLALAVIGSANTPLLLLDGDLSIIAASKSFCAAFDIKPDIIVGSHLGDLGQGEWGSRQLASLLTATAAGNAAVDAYEMGLVRVGKPERCLVLHAHKLVYGDRLNTRLLLAVADMTDARLAEKLRDDLMHEKDMLMQELQHRVANSLQIIASVLLQSAKRVGSDDTRTYLVDAHQRVMSVAALQKQLAVSRAGDVALRGYFQSLCRSIGASMIHDHNMVRLDVVADDAQSPANVAVSLGLIVTELVINALKHAFPEGHRGTIEVGYRTQGTGWTLSVEDDGVGMSKGGYEAMPGLGTGIVLALARQLKARIIVTDNVPGTAVSLIHEAEPEAAGQVTTPLPEPAV